MNTWITTWVTLTWDRLVASCPPAITRMDGHLDQVHQLVAKGASGLYIYYIALFMESRILCF